MMSPDQPALALRPRGEACRTTARIREATNFECRFLYPERKTQPENLSDAIAQSYGLEWHTYRVVVAKVEFMFSRYHGEDTYRLDEIFLYTNPKLWTKRELTAPAKGERDVFFEFEVSEAKVNTISLPADLNIDCDAEKELVVFDFAADEGATDWARVADSVLVSLTEGRALKSILFEEVSL